MLGSAALLSNSIYILLLKNVQTQIIYATMVSWMYQNTNRQAVDRKKWLDAQNKWAYS